MTETGESMARRAWKRVEYWLPLVAAALGILGWNILGALNGDSADAEGGDEPTQSETSSSAAPTEPPPTTDSTEGAETTEAPSEPDVAYLTDLTSNDPHRDVEEATVSVLGEEYGQSLRYHCDLYCDEDAPGSVEYELNGDYDRFVVMVGVSSSAEEGDQEGLFQVYLDGSPHFTEPIVVTRAAPEVINISVEGVTWLRIESYREGTVDDPMQAGANLAGGVSNKFPDLVWARPMLCRTASACDEWAEF